jgi:hypothetical protein
MKNKENTKAPLKQAAYSKELIEFASNCAKGSTIYLDADGNWYVTATQFKVGTDGKYYGVDDALPQEVDEERTCFCVNDGREVTAIKTKDIEATETLTKDIEATETLTKDIK